MLSRKDSNLDKQNQNLLCYHYTTRQALPLCDPYGGRIPPSHKMRCKDSAFSQMHKLDTPVSQLRHVFSFVRSSLWLFGGEVSYFRVSWLCP